MRALLRRYVSTLVFLVVALVAVRIGFWVLDAYEDYRTPPPVKAAREFLEALQRDDCERALARLSRSGRSAVAAEPAPDGVPARPFSYCWPVAARHFHGLAPRTVQLSAQTGGRATLTVERHESDPKSFLVPGFWATRSIVTPVTLHAVEQAGAWKVDLP